MQPTPQVLRRRAGFYFLFYFLYFSLFYFIYFFLFALPEERVAAVKLSFARGCGIGRRNRSLSSDAVAQGQLRAIYA